MVTGGRAKGRNGNLQYGAHSPIEGDSRWGGQEIDLFFVNFYDVFSQLSSKTPSILYILLTYYSNLVRVQNIELIGR